MVDIEIDKIFERSLQEDTLTVEEVMESAPWKQLEEESELQYDTFKYYINLNIDEWQAIDVLRFIDIDEANAIANEAITDETVRKETLKVIIKAIKDRGFIVDTKKNLKIDKERNIVKLVALKASGQMAEFEIQLNGKFMYHFDEYEGNACKKDIEPFLEDLKNIYDINILHEEVTWENPDKIQTQKYQYINKNKGTN